MQSHEKPQSFPSEPILVPIPGTAQVLDVQPLLALLHERYQFDKDAAVEEFSDLIEYLTREPGDNEPARTVLSCIRTAKACLVAFDSLTVHQLAAV